MRVSKNDIVKREAAVVEVFHEALKAGQTPTVAMAQDALVALDGRKMRPVRILELKQTVVDQFTTV